MDKKCEKRYTLATRAIGVDSFIVTSVIIILMIVWACLTDDKRFLFIPLFFLMVCVGIMGLLIFKLFTEPKIAIQADINGIYFYYSKNKEVFIPYDDIVKVERCGLRNVYGRILIHTEDKEYRSIKTNEFSDRLLNPIRNLVEKTDKKEYLTKIEIKQ